MKLTSNSIPFTEPILGQNQAFRVGTKVGEAQSAGMNGFVCSWLIAWHLTTHQPELIMSKQEFSKLQAWHQHFLQDKQLRIWLCKNSAAAPEC